MWNNEIYIFWFEVGSRSIAFHFLDSTALLYCAIENSSGVENVSPKPVPTVNSSSIPNGDFFLKGGEGWATIVLERQFFKKPACQWHNRTLAGII